VTDFFEQEPAVQLERLETAGRAALREWGINDASLDLIKHRENAVFRMTAGDRTGALRIHRHGYHSDDELRSELQWMQALAEAGIQVPEIVPTTSGGSFVSYFAEGLPGTLQIDLFEWIDGKQLGSVEEGVTDESAIEETYRTLGELAAMVHNQAVSWTLPGGFTRHAWDADGLAGDAPHWGRFWEIEAASDEQRALLVAARDRIHEDLSALSKSPGGYSMIHADFAAENIMVDRDGVRLIDFDDAGFGWHQFELVTALIFIMDEPYFERAQAALIDGYRQHRQLTEEQLALLPLFFLARSTTYVGWVHTRSETDTARELTPWLLELSCGLADNYLTT
jgi:Ser/Thr protein kinase RdoA (MazF antagonist)